MAAVITEMFPARIRFTGSAIAYNAAGILGAAIAPYVAVALWHTGSDGVMWVGVYLSALAALSLIAVRAGGELDARS
jgi:MFS family permease